MLGVFLSETLKWAAPKFKGAAPALRRWHTMAQLSNTNGRYFLFGGYNGGKMPLGDAFLLNIGTPDTHALARVRV